MGANSAISWTTHTMNFWVGCTKVSAGCKQCYMFRNMKRWGKNPEIVRRTSAANWRKPYAWNREAAGSDQPVYIFTNSFSDFFHEASDDWRAEAWKVIKETPNITYQVLTKRHDRIIDHLPKDWGPGYPNVWLGVSAENQKWTDKRVPSLLDVPATKRFISAEPLLGDIYMEGFLEGRRTKNEHKPIDWVIAGEESVIYQGRKVAGRPMNLDWARTLRDQCMKQGVAFFLKQREVDGRMMETPPLDGVTWTQMPETARAKQTVLGV